MPGSRPAWWRFRRRDSLWTAEAQGPLLVSLLLALVATTAYGAFYPHARPDGPQATAYAMPLIGCFLAWLHLVALPQGRSAIAALGAGWLALLAVAGAGLVVNDARAETETVSGTHGALAATPAQGGAYQAAERDRAQHTTGRADPARAAADHAVRHDGT